MESIIIVQKRVTQGVMLLMTLRRLEDLLLLMMLVVVYAIDVILLNLRINTVLTIEGIYERKKETKKTKW
jgi:hypothetical protein